MNKLIICLAGCLLLAASSLKAQDAGKQATDTTRQVSDSARQRGDSAMAAKDSTKQVKDTSILQPVDTAKPRDVPKQDATVQPAPDNSAKTQDNAAPDNATDNTKANPPAADTAAQGSKPSPKRELDTRWFISPLLKAQFQDFGMIEKNRKGYLSDANTLPFFSRGNGSFAASAYKNVGNRLSFSADLGLSFGHSTNDSVLISHTKSMTYNLLNATIFYHLLSPGYRLQPFISVGINDIVSDASYLTTPIGFGAKFNSRKIMVMGQIAYGYGLTKNIANSTMYSVGIYIPVGNKKKKQDTAQDNSAYNRAAAAKKDSAKGGIVNNFYITIKMDSLGNRKKDGDGDDDPLADYKNGGNGAKGSHKKKGTGGADDDASGGDKPFQLEDSRTDTVDGKPVYRFFVYFEFNQYTLNSKAFETVDHAIQQLHSNPGMRILINGYTDDVGTVPQNNWVSRKRSQMVFDYMNSRGIGSDRMVPKFFGKDNPVASNENPNTSWLNRRVEIIVQDKVPD